MLAISPAAPVVVVAGATMIVSKGLDVLSMHVFGKDTTELISDIALDFGEKVGKQAVKIGNKLKNVGSKIISSFRDSIRSGSNRMLGALT